MFSIVYPFYNQHVVFQHHLKVWCNYPKSIKEKIEFIIIDDCSHQPLKINEHLELNLSVYRVKDDIIWNYGAKNLGFHVAQNDWIFLSELDHMLMSDSIEKIDSLPRDNNIFYMFLRYNYAPKAHKRYKNTYHEATFFISKQAFENVGGLDEDFAGAYGYDDTYFIECLIHRNYRRIIAKDILLTNFSDNWEFPDADHKDNPSVPRDLTRNKKILKEKRALGYQVSDNRLRFNWERVYQSSLS